MFKRFILGIVLLMVLGLTQQAFAAPDPVEVERMKAESELHIIGTVVSDSLIETLVETDELVKQLRQAEIEINSIINNTSDTPLAEGELITITYTYIPNWVPMVGNRQFYLYPDDQIETWLVSNETSWSPIFGGVTVDHLHLAEDRTEPYPEPYQYDLNWLFTGILFIIVFYASYKIMRKISGNRKGKK